MHDKVTARLYKHDFIADPVKIKSVIQWICVNPFKVVFKEIPVEVVKKEFVHIPFYTNDKRLLNLDASSSEDLEGGDLDDKPLN